MAGQSEDQRAFRDVVREHGPLIARIASTYEVRPALVEELVQDVFVQLWAALPKFRGDSSLRTFVARIAHNVCVSHVRKASRAKDVDLNDDMPASGATPETATEQNLMRERLLAAVRALPLPQRQVVTLHLEGLANTEIASVLGLSDGNVAVRLNRARKRLAELMGAGT
jgi:RNA polymerase sigma-70 factor (ECF subfamily)